MNRRLILVILIALWCVAQAASARPSDARLIGVWTDNLKNRLEFKADHTYTLLLAGFTEPNRGKWQSDGTYVIYSSYNAGYNPPIRLQFGPRTNQLTNTSDGTVWLKR